MTFQTLALILLVGLLGPLLSLPRGWHVPVVVGEIAVGVALGTTGTRTLHPSDKTFTFIADLGFALVMFVAGSHVPVSDPRLKTALRPGVMRAVAVALLAIIVAVLLARGFGTGHAVLYAVLMASSSAAVVLPIVDASKLSGPAVLQLLPQVALADAACIVALPLAIDPHHAARAAAGAASVVASGVVVFFLLRYLERSGVRQRVHRVSEEHKLAIELRISLMILCALAALATRTHVSIMLAGFSFGVALAAIGTPRRLARQLFALTEGFLGPLFFVWLGASLDLRALAHHRSYILLGVGLGAGAVICHGAMRATGQPLRFGALAAAQLGVPVAAVTVGGQLHVLKPGEPAGIILGALLTVAIASAGAGFAARAEDSVAVATPPASAPGTAAGPPAPA
ncbi:MAG TPA: cation:proton antiporter [Jatrophihabitantaceae bacterium]|jgi:Kef-type K+ transport system membrane component KefB|nr:cation:proton antiporter [Jatrophihabitantaceae bacterium]